MNSKDKPNEKLEATARRLGLTLEQMPRYIAIIMDGNGRWAKNKHLPRVAGHSKGGKTVETIALDCVALGIEYLTLYSFSTENWKRPQAEINGLMDLYKRYLIGIRSMLMKNNVKLIHIGRLARLPQEVTDALDETMEMTHDNTGMILALALNYSGREEIVDAARKIACEFKDGQLELENINEQCIGQHLYDPKMPDPDILIRTANEKRISNFLLWQIAYSEFYVTKTFWPDFEKADLEQAIVTYAGRVRRFGKI